MALPRNGYVQPVEGAAGGVPIPVVANLNRSSFATNGVTVAVAGTANQAPSQAVPDGFSVAVEAKKTNTKQIYLSNSQANAQTHATAWILSPGDVVRLYITNWNLMWFDADVSNEGVNIISET
jgi:hypothetical protein